VLKDRASLRKNCRKHFWSSKGEVKLQQSLTGTKRPGKRNEKSFQKKKIEKGSDRLGVFHRRKSLVRGKGGTLWFSRGRNRINERERRSEASETQDQATRVRKNNGSLEEKKNWKREEGSSVKWGKV